MFDTIDFGIKNIIITDIIFNSNVQQYSNIIMFEYQTIQFKYYFNFRFLSIHTNAHQILNKINITLEDKTEYINKVNNILNEVIKNLPSYNVELLRIDYCVDLKLDEKIHNYIDLLNSNIHIFKYMKKDITYDTSLYLHTKQGKQNINIYDRYAKTSNINDLGILRIEIQAKKRLVKGELRKYGIARELDNYWSVSAMKDYFFNVLDGYCYNGDYYKRKISNSILDNSSNTSSMKNKLKQFLLEVERKGLENIRTNDKYNHCKINTRIQKLVSLNINPIPLSNTSVYDKLESLPYLAKKVANEKYFNKK